MNKLINVDTARVTRGLQRCLNHLLRGEQQNEHTEYVYHHTMLSLPSLSLSLKKKTKGAEGGETPSQPFNISLNIREMKSDDEITQNNN